MSWSSDRVKVKTQKAKPRQNQQDQPKAVPKPKSKAVRDIETLIEAFQTRSPNQKDEKGGCFCQARLHPLARRNTRLCLSCGLVLCNLNPPYAACPSCATPLLSPKARADMIAELHVEREDQLADEERRREEQARRVVATEGAFPTLPTSKPSTPKPGQVPQQHKILSLNAKTKKVMVQTRSTMPSPSASATATPALDPDDEEPLRIPPPSQPTVMRAPVEGRIWANLLGGAAKYIPPPQTLPQEKKSRRQRGKKKNEGE